jgi:hypothetical protein
MPLRSSAAGEAPLVVPIAEGAKVPYNFILLTKSADQGWTSSGGTLAVTRLPHDAVSVSVTTGDDSAQTLRGRVEPGQSLGLNGGGSDAEQAVQHLNQAALLLSPSTANPVVGAKWRASIAEKIDGTVVHCPVNVHVSMVKGGWFEIVADGSTSMRSPSIPKGNLVQHISASFLDGVLFNAEGANRLEVRRAPVISRGWSVSVRSFPKAWQPQKAGEKQGPPPRPF